MAKPYFAVSRLRRFEPAFRPGELIMEQCMNRRDTRDRVRAIRTAILAEEGRLRAHHPWLARLDIGLAKLNGYEACRRIREQPGGEALVIIAQTGWGQDENRERTHEAGFDHHMVKPVDPQTLMKLLAELSDTARWLR
jgi:CheY-like chemotaxis protein